VPISDIQTATRATGLGGYWGNKGGVAMSLKIFDTSVCFVNCHLDAGRNPDSAQYRNEVSGLYRGCGSVDKVR